MFVSQYLSALSMFFCLPLLDEPVISVFTLLPTAMLTWVYLLCLDKVSSHMLFLTNCYVVYCISCQLSMPGLSKLT